VAAEEFLGFLRVPQNARGRRADILLRLGLLCIMTAHPQSAWLWIVGKGVPARGKRQEIEGRFAGVFAAGIVLLATCPRATDVGVRDG
jgi:hypothetical protein